MGVESEPVGDQGTAALTSFLQFVFWSWTFLTAMAPTIGFCPGFKGPLAFLGDP